MAQTEVALPAIGWANVTDQFSPDALAAASGLNPRPGRVEAAQTAATRRLPNTETEEWRYSPVGKLSLADMAPVAEKPSSVEPLAAVRTDVEAVIGFGDRAATVLILDGHVVDVDVDDGWAAKGLDIRFDDQRAWVPFDGLPTIFDYWHQAFSPGALIVRVAAGLAVDRPVVVINHHSRPDEIGFPHLVVEVGENAELQVLGWQSSTPDTAGGSIPIVELDVGAAGRLSYSTVQVADEALTIIGRQRSSAAGQATLNTGIAAFGGRYARTRVDSRLLGRGGSANMVAAYYGDGSQVHDFRIFQHHEARDTRSDLLFKGAQDDSSGSVYTGLIHIHPEGAGTNAFQTNRNIKLSDDAWAWSVPNLEIENNEVHCSHASTVSPVDDDQRFYLGARGVPPGRADRLIVAGFFQEVINRMPVAAVRPELRRLIAAKLDRREVHS